MDPADEVLQMHLLGKDREPALVALHRSLLSAIKSKDLRTFEVLLDRHPKFDLNHKIVDQSEETCLDLACRLGLPEFVKILLNKGADPNKVNCMHSRGPIHFAVEAGHIEVLTVLLKEPRTDPNLRAAGQSTALHLGVKRNDLDAIRLLVEAGASANVPNAKGVTALHQAATKGQRQAVVAIFSGSKVELDVDRYKDYNGQTTREILVQKFPDLPINISRNQRPCFNDLRYYVNAGDTTNFLQFLHALSSDVTPVEFANELSQSNAVELLEMAIDRRMKDCVSALLHKREFSTYDLGNSVVKAIQSAEPEILLEIFKTGRNFKSNFLLDASIELGIPGKQESADLMRKRVECLKIILEREEDVRCTDGKGNTPLHYAARSGCNEATTLLLHKGSYIGHPNCFNAVPLDDIHHKILEQHLDQCIIPKSTKRNDLFIEFDYRCLIPHKPTDTETDVLLRISKNVNLKYLLKHPLISSYLYIKWHKIRKILYVNFVLYFLFYASLNFYILNSKYTEKLIGKELDEKLNEKMNEDNSTTKFFQYLTTLTLVPLLFKNVVSFLITPINHLLCIESWFDFFLYSIVIFLLFEIESRVCAIVILLSAWKLVILIGQHPKMSTSVEIFKTVSLNFSRLFFLYAFLIASFALAFFVLFRKFEEFQGPGRSLFKTFIMITGEFEAENIPFEEFPIAGRILFVFFVFFIAIVLFNLLNGLAVSDTVEILGKAELVGLVSRIKLVSYVEGFVVRDGGRWMWVKRIMDEIRKRVMMFPKGFQNGTWETEENLRDGKLTIPWQEDLTENSKTFRMDSKIMKKAEEVLRRRERMTDTEKTMNKLEELDGRLARLESNTSHLKYLLDQQKN